MKCLLLPCALLAFNNTASAISVYVAVYAEAFCGQSTGELIAFVDGGVAPYRYDWYREVGGDYEPQCMDCTDRLANLPEGTYRLVVTDADQESVENFSTVQAITFGEPNATEWTGDWGHFLPYQNGERPVLQVDNPMFGYIFYAGVDTVYPLTIETSPASFCTESARWGFRRFFSFPPGTTSVTLTFSPLHPLAQHCASVSHTYTVPPPTTPPSITLGPVDPVCPNGWSMGDVLIDDFTAGTPYNLVDPDGQCVGTSVSAFSQFAFPAGTSTLKWTGLSCAFWPFGDQLPFYEPYQVEYSIYDPFAEPQGPPAWFLEPIVAVQVTVPVRPDCRTVSGTVFIDSNSNCTQQGNEPAVPSAKVQVVPGPYFATTNSAGNYTVQLPPGSYTVREADELLAPTCNPGGVPVTISTANATVQLPCSATVAMDAGISLSSGAARPGFELLYGIGVSNHTPLGSGAITVSVQLDPAIGFLSASPVPTTVNGQTITWNLSALPGYQSTSLTIRTQIPADIGLLGTDLTTTATVTTAFTDGNPANNTATAVRTVTGSYDPNDKLATTSLGNGAVVGYDPAVDDWIDYTIRFQNTGTDTAFHVLITDTLPSGLDPSTLRMGAASHNFTWELLGQGVLKFRLYHILLPDSNVNEPRSHGFVSFSMRPIAGALDAPSDRVDNIANIYFDFNPPVITEPSVVSIELPTRISAQPLQMPNTYPNPAQAVLNVVLPTPEAYTADLVSMDGRVLRSLGVIRSGTTIDVASLASGAYLLRLASPMHGVSQARFVKE